MDCGLARFGDDFERLKRIRGMLHFEGLLWSVRTGESFNENLIEWEGCGQMGVENRRSRCAY